MALIPDIKPIHVADGGSGGVRPYLPTESTDQASMSDAGDETNGNFDPWSWFWKIFGAAAPGGIGMTERVTNVLADESVKGILEQVGDGTMSALDAQKAISNDSNLRERISPEQTEYLTNMIEQFVSQQAYDRSIQSIKDSALAQQEAAIATGINPSAYIQGQSAGFNAAKADVSHNNVAQTRFQQKASMARTALALTGMMASAGIRGGSYIAGRKAVSKLAGSAFSDSISSLGANRSPRRAEKISHRQWNKLIQELEY